MFAFVILFVFDLVFFFFLKIGLFAHTTNLALKTEACKERSDADDAGQDQPTSVKLKKSYGE